MPTRYVLDPLYGPISPPPKIWRLMLAPELQRLREVRMCNINSLSLTGAGSPSRYEHVVGTGHLATLCMDQWPTVLPEGIKDLVQTSALLHDVMTAPFGHSVEYVLKPRGFEHESLEGVTTMVSSSRPFEYFGSDVATLFFGQQPALAKLLTRDELDFVGRTIRGEGQYGPLISGPGMDLDNIDNVYRMAYHMGIPYETDAPRQLAMSLSVDSDGLVVDASARHLVRDWYQTRRRVYEFLLLNPDEFSGKCMLQIAVEEAIRDKGRRFEPDWSLTDYELIQELASPDAPLAQRTLINRLMNGNLFGCIGIFATNNLDVWSTWRIPEERESIESALNEALQSAKLMKSPDVRLHLIYDVNKTQREIDVRFSDGSGEIIGSALRRVLIGVFLANANEDMHSILSEPRVKTSKDRRECIRHVLRSECEDHDLAEVDLFSEATSAWG